MVVYDTLTHVEKDGLSIILILSYFNNQGGFGRKIREGERCIILGHL